MKKILRKLYTTGLLLKEKGLVFVARYAWHKFIYKSGLFSSSYNMKSNICPKEIFEYHYKYRSWMDGGNLESVSGSGSTIEYTRYFREGLEKIIRKYEFKSLFDAPCGDFNWMKLVIEDLNVSYIGGDIVEELINVNRGKFRNQNIEFIVFDITSNDFPKADLWLCRDCLFHLSYQNIFRALKMFMASEVNYCLITTQLNENINEDIKDGDFRRLNLMLSPFSFPQPRALLRDFPDGHDERYVGLWSKCDLRVAAKSWPDLD